MPEFEEYVQKYATKHNISVEEVKQHAIVQSVKSYYENRDKMTYTWW